MIDRSSLWAKLLENHINGNILNVMYNIYRQAKSCVKNGSEISEYFDCKVGVRQGDNLSPLLFAIYLNDFEYYISRKYYGLKYLGQIINEELGDDDIELFIRMFVLLYADDTVILAENSSQLQKALDATSDYCKKWKLTVNLSKTKIIIFSKGKITMHPNFTFNNKIVEVVDDYVYLGTTFNYNGSFTKAIKKQVSQAQKAMFSLLTKARRLLLPIDIQLDLFEKMVVPILLYGCEVWGCTNMKIIEVFYKKFLKIILCVSKSTPSCKVYGETGKLSLLNVINKRIITFWIKISEDKCTKLATIMFKTLFNTHSKGKLHINWIENIKNILESCHFSNLWQYQKDYASKKSLKKSIFKALDDRDVESWRNETTQNIYSDHYKLFKIDFETEKYLTTPDLTFDQRRFLAKFRCGDNKLPVNKHRFSTNVEEKICSLCTSNEIGDEYHYLFICSVFSQERNLYLPKSYFEIPNESKFKKLLQTKEKNMLIKLAKFSRCIIEKFKL